MTAAGSILVVEDDRDIRESLIEILEDEGYAVVAAADGAEALAHLRAAAQPPALILLDLMMPNMNGFQFREAQLQLPAYADIPVAVITADRGASAQAAALRVSGLVHKPLKIQALLDLVSGLVGRPPR